MSSILTTFNCVSAMQTWGKLNHISGCFSEKLRINNHHTCCVKASGVPSAGVLSDNSGLSMGHLVGVGFIFPFVVPYYSIYALYFVQLSRNKPYSIQLCVFCGKVTFNSIK